MATIRKKHRAPVPVFQRDPGPWSRLLIDWLATLAVIMIFGLVMLFSASYTTGYLRMGDSFHYIKQQVLATEIATTSHAEGLELSLKFGDFDLPVSIEKA